MARDRQWVVLDRSQNATKDREAAARETEEHEEGTDLKASGHDLTEYPGSYGPGE